MEIDTEPIKKKGRPKKYFTSEEARIAFNEQQRNFRARMTDEQKQKHKEQKQNYINKIGIEAWKQKVRVASLKCYYRNKEKNNI